MTPSLAERYKTLFERLNNSNGTICELEDYKNVTKYRFGCRPSDAPHGYVIGTKRGADGELYIHETSSFSQALLCSPSGSGKTQGFISNQLINAKNVSYIVLDTKSEILSNTYGKLCQTYGKDKVKVINFANPENTDLYFNPLSHLAKRFVDAEKLGTEERKREEGAIYAEVETLVSFLFPDSMAGSDRSWHLGTIDMIVALTIACLEDCRGSITDKTGIRRQLSPEEVTLEKLNNLFKKFTLEGRGEYDWGDRGFFSSRKADSYARKRAFGVMKLEARSTRSCYFSLVSTYLGSVSSTKSLALTSHNSIDFDNIDDGDPCVLFIRADILDNSMKSLLNLFIQYLLNAYVKKCTKTATSLKTPLVLLLDEFPILSANDIYPTLASVGRSMNIFCAFVIQSLSQLDDQYKEKANVIKENCVTKIFLSENFDRNARLSSNELGVHQGVSISDLMNCRLTVKDVENVPPQKLLFGMEPGECYIRLGNRVVHSNYEFFYKTPEYKAFPAFDISKITAPPMFVKEEIVEVEDETDADESESLSQVEEARRLLEKRKAEILKRIQQNYNDDDDDLY